MSRTIDERIVDMQFNNRQFEDGVKDSLNSLDNLKKGLSMEGIGHSIDQIADRFTTMGVVAMTAIQNITNRVIDLGVDMVKSLTVAPIAEGFGKYEQIVGAQQTIINATGKSMEEVADQLQRLNKFTDETSFQLNNMVTNIGKFTGVGIELDTAVTAMQGIGNYAALSGMNIEKTSNTMDVFAKSIGQGAMQLKEWKQIENMNGGTIEFKQTLIDTAVAAGTLTKNLDPQGNVSYWANWVDPLSGKLKSAEVSVRDFTSALTSSKWLNTDVMLKTMDQYGAASKLVLEIMEEQGVTAAQAIKQVEAMGDETLTLGLKAFRAAQEAKTFTDAINSVKDAVSTGWMNTFQIIFGNYEEAKTLWTDVADGLWEIFASGAESRNEMLQEWKDMGGRDVLLESLTNAFEALGKVIAPIKEAFRDFFPAMTADRLFALTEKFRDFTERLKIGDETADKLKRTFSGLFAVLDLIKQGVGFVLKVFGELISAFAGPATGGILGLTAKFGDFLVKIHDTATEAGFLQNAFNRIKDVIHAVADGIGGAVQRIKEAFGGFGHIDTDPLDEFTENTERKLRPLAHIGQIISSAFEAIVKVIEWAAPIIKKVGSIIGNALGKLADLISNAVRNMEFSDILDLINTGLFGGLLLKLNQFVGGIGSAFGGFEGVLKGITRILDGVRGSLEAYQSKLKAQALMQIALAVGILAAALFVLSTIPSEKLTTALGGITVLFVEISAAFIVLNKATGGGMKMTKVSVALVAFSAAILILAVAMTKVADLDWDEIGKGLVAIAGLMTELVIFTKFIDPKRLTSTGIGLIGVATAMRILASAMKEFGTMAWDEIGRGLTVMGGALAEITIALNLMPKGMINKATGLTVLSVAMRILGSAMQKFGSMNWGEIARGLVVMAGALTAITIALNLMPKGMINKATGLTILGSAMLILGSAMKKFGTMTWDEIGRGLVVMAGALTAITIALNLMPKGMINKATAITILSASLHILAAALMKMADMTWEQIAKGLITLAGSMLILAVSLNAMQKALPGAAAMLVIAPALAIMAGVLKILGSMSLDEIGTALLALAGTFTVLGVAALVLKPIIPALLGIAGALALMGAAVVLVGIGVLALATGLTALAVSATAAAAAITVIGAAVLGLIPIFFKKVGEGIVAILKVIINAAPLIKDAFLVLLSSALEVLSEAGPMVTSAIFPFILSILDALDEYLPQITDKLFSIVIGFLDKMAENLPALIKSGANLLSAFLTGIFEAMGGYNPENLLGLLACITTLVGIFAILAASKKLGKDAIIAVGMMAVVMGIITAIFVVISSLDIDNVLGIALSLSAVLMAISGACFILSKVPIQGALTAVAALGIFVAGLIVVLTALGGLMQIPGIEWLLGEGSRMLQMLGEALGGFVGSIVGGFLGGMTDSLPRIGENLSAFMKSIEPFIQGAKEINPEVMKGVLALAGVIGVLTAASLIEGLTSWLTGGSSMAKFGEELCAFAPYFAKYYDTIKHIDGSVVEASANAALALSNFAQNLPKEGGFWQSIVGTSDLTKFANELVTFGPALMAYARSVRGLDARVVEESANAAMALSDLADNLPKHGGFWQDLIGDSSLTTFALELASFGPAMKKYADSVSGLNPDVVTNSANAAKGLAELANNLPNSGGLVSLFTGDNSIGVWGKDVAEFGRQFAIYYEHIKGIGFLQMSGVIKGVNALVEMAKNITESKLDGLTTFAKDLQKQGEMGIGGFLKAFDEAAPRVKSSISNVIALIVAEILSGQPRVISQTSSLITSMINAITSLAHNFANAAQTILTNFISGINNKKPHVVSSFITIITDSLAAVKRRESDWITSGANLVNGFILGIKKATPKSVQEAVLLATETLKAVNQTLGINSPSTAFQNVGKYSVEGLAKGLTEGFPSIIDKAGQLGMALLKGIQDRLGINSPSTVARDEVGRYFVQGIAEGIKADTSPEEAARIKAKNIVDAFKTEFDKFSLNTATADLEYKLWESLNANASTSEKSAVEMSMLTEKIAIQTERVALAQAEYTETVKTFGAASTEAQQAYNKFLQEQINLEDAAKAKAKSVTNAFSAEFEKMNQAASAIDLDYKLWESLNKNATEGEKTAAEMSVLNDKIAIQTDRVALAQAEYTETINAFGATSTEAQQTYSKFLQEQINLADALNKIKDLQAEYAVQQGNAYNKYLDYLQQNSERIEFLKGHGFSIEDIQDAAIEHSGYDPSKAQKAMASDVKKSVMSAMDTVGQVYESNSEKAFGELQNDFSSWGSNYAESMGKGIQQKSPLVVDKATQMVQNTIEAVKRRESDWITLGRSVVDGYIKGIVDNMSRAIGAAVEMAVSSYLAAMDAIGAASPAKKFIEMGKFADMGLAVGFERYSHLAEDEAEGVGYSTLDILRDAMSGISESLTGELDMTPTIRPVIDMTDVKAGAKDISALMSSKHALSLSGTKAVALAAQSSDHREINSANGVTSAGQQFIFNQTNNSPKALSRIDIYRQTKNQFSMLKGVVSNA